MKINKGLLYKKKLDSNGNQIGVFPYLLKTLASLVFMKNGKSVEESVSALETEVEDLSTKKTYLVYETYADYQVAFNAGEIPEGTMCVIKKS